ncbi:MAG: hypothetical protein DI616_14820 [Paracoccus denitrificans]|uniref:Type II toxin-antitoxin system ParD family antitoxin n=1 Tax=Paracoccus denitrificans TaxID=266 RepID=A0A533I437_PARDE|nr:MAG: hypothetical protein DI616_14820 [Paracoccus denitrificans]
MTVRSSISLTDPQNHFARTLVESGQYASLSSVLQHGLELLRQKIEAEELELAALRQLVDRRVSGPIISSAEMDARIDRMFADQDRRGWSPAIEEETHPEAAQQTGPAQAHAGAGEPGGGNAAQDVQPRDAVEDAHRQPGLRLPAPP